MRVERKVLVLLMDNYRILSWNVRGLNSTNKQDAILDICSTNKVGVGALLETKMRGNKVNDLMTHKFTNWNFYSCSTTEGRILLIWRKAFVQVIVLEESNQYVHCLVKIVGLRQDFSTTFVYGLNTGDEWKRLWQGLAKLNCSKPWIIVGDFNAIFNMEDRSGGKAVSASELIDSTQWLALNQVDALKSTGSFFTWTNNQKDQDRINSRIDHVFTDEDWLDYFPNTSVIFRWEHISHHCSCIISFAIIENIGFKLFRFYNFWADHKDFKKEVLES